MDHPGSNRPYIFLDLCGDADGGGQMIKLQRVKSPRNKHTCTQCRGGTKPNTPVIALVVEDFIDGNRHRFISYFCCIECYNDFELKKILTTDDGDGMMASIVRKEIFHEKKERQG